MVTDTIAVPAREQPATRPAGRRDVDAALVTAGAAYVASLVVVLAGGTPAALLAVGLALGTAAVARWLSVPLALAAVLLSGLVLLALTMRVLPATGLGVAWALALPALGGAGAWVALWSRRRRLRAPTRSAVLLGGAVTALSVLQVAAVVLIRLVSDLPKLAWLMRNDNPWNFVSARFLIEDGGLDPAAHRNPAPLANEFVALFLAPGRGGVPTAELLAFDLGRTVHALLLLVSLMSVLGGLLVAAVVAADRRWSRLALAAVATAVPWSWAVAGEVFTWGFWNSLLAGSALLAVWAAWSAAPRSPRLSSALMGVAGTVLLATWAPLVAVPAVLGVVVVVRHHRAHLALRGRALVAWSAPFVVLLAYAALVTVPDIAAVGEGLGEDGGFPVYGQHLPVIVAATTLAVLLTLQSWSGQRWELLGVALVVAVAIAGALYLMAQREGHPTGPWGYYPQKFTWTLSLLAPVVVLRAVGRVVGVPALRAGQRRGLVLGAAVIAGAVMLQVPPSDPRPATPTFYPIARGTPDWRLSSLWPVLSMAYEGRSSGMDAAAQALLDVADPGEKAVVARWSGDPGYDGLTNYWLLQLPVNRADQMPRPYAFGIDTNDPNQLCALSESWGGGVVVHTRDAALAREVEQVCPTGDLVVTMDD